MGRDMREANAGSLKFVQAHGFKNVQKRLEKPDHGMSFVEVMACPGGCLNGGGQISGKNLAPALDARLREVEVSKHSEDSLDDISVAFKSVRVNDQGKEMVPASVLKW